jgi:dienelactone hydrolase
MIERISEQAVLLGQRKSLVGILTQAVTSARTDEPAIVILNTGIIHRVGHHRMYVTLSRILARAGYTVLRFDFSGIGDSDARADGLSPLDSCLADIKEVLDWLETNCQASRIILVGLCSGADHAVLYGHTDPRVVALVLMDPSIPATARYYVHYIGQRLIQLRSWVNVAVGRSRIVSKWIEQGLYILSPEWKTRHLSLQNPKFRACLEQVYQNSVDCGIQILAVFTEETTRQTYREQMIDAFPNVSFGEQLQLEFFQNSDHTFTLANDRSKLIRLVLEWIKTTKFNNRPRASANSRS